MGSNNTIQEEGSRSGTTGFRTPEEIESFSSMALRGSWGIGGQERFVGKGASSDYNECMTKLACLQRMVL
jgi:hypothetical protein